MFSKGSNIVTTKRNCLKLENVERLMFLAKMCNVFFLCIMFLNIFFILSIFFHSGQLFAFDKTIKGIS